MLTKYVESLSENYCKVSDGQLLQIPTAFFITKYDTVYCKLRQVLQSAMIITNCDSTSLFWETDSTRNSVSKCSTFLIFRPPAR